MSASAGTVMRRETGSSDHLSGSLPEAESCVVKSNEWVIENL
jgi:hypothetical protein